MLNTEIPSAIATVAQRLNPSQSRDESGAGIVEYLLLVLFIALALIAALTLFSGALSDVFSTSADSVAG